MEPLKCPMPHFRHSLKRCLSQIPGHKVLRIKKNAVQDFFFPPDELKLKLNQLARTMMHITVRCLKKRPFLLLITTEEQSYILSESKIKYHVSWSNLIPSSNSHDHYLFTSQNHLL